jgi:hypothetical protein
MGDHLTPDQKSKLQRLFDENRNIFAFTMEATTIRGDTIKITPDDTDDTPTLKVLRPATLGLQGGLGPFNESAQDNDTVVFHPTKADENEAKPSLDSQAMDVAPQQSKLKAIAKMAPPTTVSGLQSLPWHCRILSASCPELPSYHRPSERSELQSGVAWEWTPEAPQSFEELKATLATKAQACEVCHDTAVNRRTGAMPLC